MIETDVNSLIRIEGAKRGVILWRNNSGAFEDKTGRWIRYGLANDSARTSELVKSSDLIGIGMGWWWGFPAIMGFMMAIEAKRSGWTFTGQGRETAQANYLTLVRRYGGCACFATSWEDVDGEITRYLQARANFAGGPGICATTWLPRDNMRGRGRRGGLQLQDGGAALVQP
ncbi:MAG TPA: hypothetical protein VMT30_02570 [Candidatus Saccharimonadia bacterium]|nr:hypothetical protein [Candidatus Saccharimonadia bacterium]